MKIKKYELRNKQIKTKIKKKTKNIEKRNEMEYNEMR